MEKDIIITRARENNLKNLSVRIPKNRLVVITGPSGSGKSTLAIDTIFHESMRQYLEAIGLQGINKPKVDSIRNLSPAISIDQKTNRNPRSTVGTATDLYTDLRLIFAKLGVSPCPFCGEVILPSLKTEGNETEDQGDEVKKYVSCPKCHHRLEKRTLSHFSYNTAEGACPVCHGLGETLTIVEDRVFHQDLALENGAVDIWEGRFADYSITIVKAAMKHYGVPLPDMLPLKDYEAGQKAILYYGVESDEVRQLFPEVKPPKTVEGGKFEGVLTSMWRRLSEKKGHSTEAETYFHHRECPLCHGERLNQESRMVTVEGKRIPELVNLPLEGLLSWIESIEASLPSQSLLQVETFLWDMKTKLNRIIRTGLGYLSLDRQTITLSGGETERIKLAALLDSSLTGVLYVLDEPTQGLHPRDTMNLISVMKELRDLGNTVLVIEHDPEVMREADYIIDIGPGAGKNGGTVVGQGTLNELMHQPASITGRYLARTERIKESFRSGNGRQLIISHATIHNLKDITVGFPEGCLVAVTGVSGSGKSSLVFEGLAEGQAPVHEGFEAVTGLDHFDEKVIVNQTPLVRMSRSNVATYIDVYTEIRKVYANLPEASAKGLSPKHFSFNTPGGRCENCEGMGFVTTNMLFFPDLEVTCGECSGKRFKPEILSVEYNGLSISDVLDASVSECAVIFQDNEIIRKVLTLLVEIGLGYLKLGQSLTTLSNGEGERLKLAKELLTKTGRRTLYLIDEPTTGLHPTDVDQLLEVLNRLVDAGNTVIVVEHNTQIIKNADWVIDLGPEGGDKGGRVVAEGTPADIARRKDSYTGAFL